MKEHNLFKSNLTKLIITFVFLIIAECLILVLVALIPNSSLQKNFQESADYLCEKQVFFYANEHDKSSKIDRYADSILLNIAYNYDQSNPLSSVMSSSYYFNIDKNENTNLKFAVYENPSPTLEYSRYWHGSIAFVRPLLTIFNIEQIYIINALLLFVLFLFLIINVYKSLGKGAAICFIVSCVMVSLWYVPMSLEYIWTLFIMFIASIICLKKINSKNSNFLIFFFIIGNLTSFIDFLTTETLTLLMPMSLMILYNHIAGRTTDLKTESLNYIKFSLSWISGYALTWIAKWSLASIVLQKNVFKTAITQASFRATGDAENVSGFAERLGAEARNISCIFPFSLMNSNSLFFAFTFLIITLCILYLIRKEKCTTNYLLMIVALIPYIRFFILANHSYLHYFFTFRAQLATIFCIGLILVYGSDRVMLSKEWRKIWKKK